MDHDPGLDMNMEQRISEQLKEAMKRGDKPRLMALRSLKSLLTNERTRHSSPLTEDQEIKVIASHRRQMDGARRQYLDAGRGELAGSAALEIEICEGFLPPPLDSDELAGLVDEVIAQTGASKPGDLGKVMGPLMKQLAGRVDGNEVRRLVVERLGG